MVKPYYRNRADCFRRDHHITFGIHHTTCSMSDDESSPLFHADTSPLMCPVYGFGDGDLIPPPSPTPQPLTSFTLRTLQRDSPSITATASASHVDRDAVPRLGPRDLHSKRAYPRPQTGGQRQLEANDSNAEGKPVIGLKRAHGFGEGDDGNGGDGGKKNPLPPLQGTPKSGRTVSSSKGAVDSRKRRDEEGHYRERFEQLLDPDILARVNQEGGINPNGRLLKAGVFMLERVKKERSDQRLLRFDNPIASEFDFVQRENKAEQQMKEVKSELERLLKRLD